MKRFLYYLIWTLVIGGAIYLGNNYQLALEEQSETTFNIIPVLIFATIFPLLVGILLRLPKLIIDIKEKRPWTFDWVKGLAIVLPALYITILPLLSYTSVGMNLPFANEVIFFGNSLYTTTAGIVAGYVLLDSFVK
ncbi:hypothetical protein GH754_12610 [Salinibacillus xinjiangensis]|uniref:Uncharacterized protein n=1 Tax=Salinibacillus xinjiangensis TaxID=1229268 RepID=A0A6G1X820_9BACI|nr:hypothetical protein [Salinibacillus xinjiangensis]